MTTKLRNVFLLFLFIFSSSLLANEKGPQEGIEKVCDEACQERTYETTDDRKLKNQYYECLDGSISHAQPGKKEGANRDGLCGATAALNMIKMYCPKYNTETVQEFDRYFVDPLYNYDGTYTSTLVSALKKGWDYYCDTPRHGDFKFRSIDYDDAKTYLEKMWNSLNWNEKGFFKRKLKDGSKKQKWPLIASIDHELTGGHWVTVIDIESDLNLSQLTKKKGSLKSILKDKKCHVIYNTWMSQRKVPCTTFALWAAYPNSRFHGDYEFIDLIKR